VLLRKEPPKNTQKQISQQTEIRESSVITDRLSLNIVAVIKLMRDPAAAGTQETVNVKKDHNKED
jgi:hypothetical protein